MVDICITLKSVGILCINRFFLRKTLDVLGDVTTNNEVNMKCDLLLDKGTFDAISLMEDFGSEVRERYLKACHNLLKKDGLFLIATCNWTIDEIEQHMATCTELISEPPIVSSPI